MSLATFTALGAVGPMTAAQFESGAGLADTATPAGRFSYNTTTGALNYDADGSGVIAPVLVGTFTGAPALTAANFSIVA